MQRWRLGRVGNMSETCSNRLQIQVQDHILNMSGNLSETCPGLCPSSHARNIVQNMYVKHVVTTRLMYVRNMSVIWPKAFPICECWPMQCPIHVQHLSKRMIYTYPATWPTWRYTCKPQVANLSNSCPKQLPSQQIIICSSSCGTGSC